MRMPAVVIERFWIASFVPALFAVIVSTWSGLRLRLMMLRMFWWAGLT